MIEEKQINRTLKIYPIFSSLIGDILFFAAINTLFLSLAKGMSAFEITLMNIIGAGTSLLLRPLFSFILTKLKNTKTLRLGSFFMLISAILFTIGDIFVIFLADIFYYCALLLLETRSNILKNNLVRANKSSEYMKKESNAKFCYNIISCIGVIFAPTLFNINYYLPMVLAIILTSIGLLLSFFMTDTKNENINNKTSKEKINFPKIIWLILVLTIIFIPIILRSTIYIKLLAQDLFLLKFNEQLMVYLVSFLVLASRISRILCSFIFSKICDKFKPKHLILFSTILLTCLILTIVSFSLDLGIVAVILIFVCFFVMYGLMDPWQIYIKHLLLEACPDRNSQQKAISWNQSTLSLGQLILNVIATFILLGLHQIYVLVIFTILNLLFIFYCFYFISVYSKTNSNKQETKNNSQN